MKKLILVCLLAYSTMVASTNIKGYSIQKQNILKLENFKKSLKKEKNNLKIIRKVNSFFNKFKYKTDLSNYSKREYWATQSEFLRNNGGDCEDFAIAKYTLLKEFGFSDYKLVYKKIGIESHVMLAVKYKNKYLILDSYNKSLRKLNKTEAKSIYLVINNVDSRIAFYEKAKKYDV